MEKGKIIKGIIVLVIVFIVFFLIGYFVMKQVNNINYNIEEIKEFKYSKVYINKKYGIIDEKGNIIIEAKYDNIDIPNPSKDVFFVYSNYDSQKGKYETQVINSKNEKILTQFEELNPIQLKGANSEVPYEKSTLVYKENNKYGIVDFSGKKITKAKYDSIESFLYKEGCLLVRNEDKYGILIITGKEIIEPKYDYISSDGYYDAETKNKKAGFIIGEKQESGYRYGYIDSNANLVLDIGFNSIGRITDIDDEVYLLATKNGQQGVYKNKDLIINHGYSEIEYDKQSDMFMVSKNEKYGVLSKDGKEVLSLNYDYILISKDIINAQQDDIIYVFDKNGNKLDKENLQNTTVVATENDNYYITINDSGKFGIIDKNYSQIFENKYQYIEYAFDDNFIINDGDRVGIMSVNGDVKINFEYNFIQRVKNADVIQAIKFEDNVSDFYTFNFVKTLSMENADVRNEDNYLKVLSDNNRKYIDNKGNKLDSKELFSSLKLFAVNQNGKWGFVDKDGKMKVNPIYDMVTEFNSYGYAGILKDGKWGVINDNGEIVQEPYYEIEWNEPEFINKYIKLDFGFGFYYYTNEIENED